MLRSIVINVVVVPAAAGVGCGDFAELEKQNPGLVAARDQAIVELRREKLQEETAQIPGHVAKMRR